MAPEKKDMKLTPDCAAGVDLQGRVGRLEQDSDEQWKTINSLRNRLPVWATVVMMVLSGLIGSALTYAAVAAKLAGV